MMDEEDLVVLLPYVSWWLLLMAAEYGEITKALLGDAPTSRNNSNRRGAAVRSIMVDFVRPIVPSEPITRWVSHATRIFPIASICIHNEEAFAALDLRIQPVEVLLLL